MNKKRRKLLRQSFKVSGLSYVLITYMSFFIAAAVILFLIDPGIRTVGEGFWYCFAAATTIGFGDVAAVSPAGRVLTIILSVYSMAVIAIFTAMITSFFMESAKLRVNESVQEFLDDLEHLPELSKEELRELSEKVKKYHP